jgi:hypothetical protein
MVMYHTMVRAALGPTGYRGLKEAGARSLPLTSCRAESKNA